MACSIAGPLVAWQRECGRHDLPWQAHHPGAADPYHVWLSEVMLQQTQVSTVRGYFARFVDKFPTVQSLAAASLDEVLAAWSGMGYYARARNLHHAARQVVRDYAACLPTTSARLQMLRGVGRSTACAIAAFCFGERVSILDANAARVLARVLAFEGDLSLASQKEALWQQANALVPHRRAHMPAYTQALMDLGALICRHTRAECTRCPLRAQCKAYAEDAVYAYPRKSRRHTRTRVSWWLLLQVDKQGRVLLQQRDPGSGIWAGMWTLPAFDSEQALRAATGHARVTFAPVLRHVLTHRDLWLHVGVCEQPLSARRGLGGEAKRVSSDRIWRYFDPEAALQLGLPAPMRKILTVHFFP